MADHVTRTGDGAYRVEHEGRASMVFVVRDAGGWWAFSEGQVFRSAAAVPRPGRSRRASGEAATEVTAPMPATVVAVHVTPGDRVRKGDVLVVIDAMKMEMPLRADADGQVKAVRCRSGELVQADAVLVELI